MAATGVVGIQIVKHAWASLHGLSFGAISWTFSKWRPVHLRATGKKLPLKCCCATYQGSPYPQQSDNTFWPSRHTRQLLVTFEPTPQLIHLTSKVQWCNCFCLCAWAPLIQWRLWASFNKHPKHLFLIYTSALHFEEIPETTSPPTHYPAYRKNHISHRLQFSYTPTNTS